MMADSHDTVGYEYELHSDGTDWNEDYNETDNSGTTDHTLSEPIPALLDDPVEIHEGHVNKLETVQEAVAAANPAADMSRRTWTQARQLMKDVHRSRGYFAVSKSNHMMEVNHGRGKSRGIKRRFVQGQGEAQKKSQGKGKGKRKTPPTHTKTRTQNTHTRTHTKDTPKTHAPKHTHKSYSQEQTHTHSQNTH